MRLLPLLAILLLTTAAHAADQQDKDDAPAVNPLASNGDYLSYHPDLGDRKMGMEAYGRGSYDYAARCFRWAARYADKPSEAMLASMYWDGKGVPQDHALGYAWMDLAAERGYPSLLAFRERYWDALTDDERKRVAEVGQPLYDEYGDAVAKPRLATMMRRGLHEVTGSHTGFVGTMQIQIPSFSGNPEYIDANQYYDPRFWQPRAYWAWADRAWKVPHGTVNVGRLESAHEAKPAPADDGKNDERKH
jgi:hypothetical protein